ncbi:MAG: hypothetical protein COU81_00365 [Candidatus Portnoybacteria bacterium CG10_big_fil_rev_8_21_14_0_10_36_7]|uniref:NYN domain-containing protein n=1 Tax=Candidatus Portnoybacteria bacterium CG10_big_fil_rev_8_21_14_0_10_36_7 TaxID=1974812 RepID=A0A2M8KF13_9BACT|nr:MAG: hypothetical protein COU81_00365 [Candidatus Portnoybacteria bacterium CG10_big_fil_rev_8_21_14_0_10_36_7]
MSVIKHKEQRVALLIDTQNMYHSARNLYASRVNFKEVLKLSVNNRKLIRAISYGIKTEGQDEKTFFEALTRLGIETKMKDLQVYAGGMKKGDWDVGIAIDAVRLSSSVDVIVLISGDGDFVPLVEYLKNQGKQVEIVAFAKTTSQKLKDASDDFQDIGSPKFLIKSDK